MVESESNVSQVEVRIETQALLERFSALLLEIYRIAADSPTKLFQERALAAVQKVVPFDSAMWASGTASAAGPVAHAVYPDRQPSEMMQSYESVKQHDTLAVAAYRSLGITLNVSASDPHFVPHPDLAAFTRRFGLTYTLSTNVADGMHLFTAVSLFRADLDRPYSETERQLVQALVPHLVETWSNCRLRSVGSSTELEQSPRARALCDRTGLLHAAAPAFATLLRTEWLDWQGPVLPDALQGNWLPPARQQYTGLAVVVTSEPVGDLRLLKLRKISLLDTLTTRELEVARLFGSGTSHKAIAETLGVSPATIRNHLQSAYSKLGVSDKAALAKLLHIAES